MSRPQISSSNLGSATAAMKNKVFDYSDHHYRDAICRLKVMLSDSSSYSSPPRYNPSLFKSTVNDDDTDTTENTIVERPLGKDVNKYVPYKTYSTCSMASSAYKPPSYLKVPCKSSV